jgi:ABC-type transport system involved in cytochrome bd biosynthesis fused ATPase/permease subunit
MLGLVPQGAYLFSGRLRQNLLIARPDASDADLEQAIDRAELGDLVRRLPRGMDTWLGSQGEQLSGGERQRLALARASLQNPKIWILDEPTAGLDAATGKRLLATVRFAFPERSLILITHHLPGLDWLDEIIVLRDGRITERGTHAELVRHGSWYASALALQKKVIDPDDH